MGMASVGVVRAEGEVVTSAGSTDLVVIQKIDSSTGQYSPRMITVGNLLTTTPTGFTAGSVIFADTGGDLAEDNTNFFWNDSTNTLRATNVDAGASGTAGTIDIFPTTASKGKLAFAAADSAGNTTTTITNASQAAARTYTIPDAGASASFVMTEGAQTINGIKTIPAIVTTDIDAGASGTAGSLDIFPTTSAKGKLTLTAGDSAGNTTTAIVNASQAGARTYTIPDAGASASFMMTQGAQTVVGAQTFSADMTVNANVLVSTIGKGLQVKTGSNSRIGSATLSGGTVTVSNTTITTATKVFITTRTLGTVATAMAKAVTAIVANTSFTITSSDATDTSVVDWMLVESIA